MNIYKINISTENNQDNESINEAIKVLDVCAEKFNFELILDKKNKANFSSDTVLFNQMGESIKSLTENLKIHSKVNYFKVYNSLTEKSTLKPHVINETDIEIFQDLNSNNTIESISKTLHLAFKSSVSRKQKLCLTGKFSILESSKIWKKTALSISKTYPNVTLNFLNIDELTKELMINPRQFDVIVTEEIFGDIITNLTSLLISSKGILPQSFVGDKISLFGPDNSENHISKSNPIATVLSAALMLDYLGEKDASNQIISAVNWTIENRFSTEDINAINPVSTKSVGNKIVEFIKNNGHMEAFKKEFIKEEFLYR